MDGFVHDYCSNLVAINSTPEKKGDLPTFDQYPVIMDCFGPQSVPVISKLAKEFAVYDAWHSAVPSQTFCNRSFFHASSSSGFVVNEPYAKWASNLAPTIFNRLADAGVSWKIYYDASQFVSLTGLIHFPVLVEYLEEPFRNHGDVLPRMWRTGRCRPTPSSNRGCSGSTTTTIHQPRCLTGPGLAPRRMCGTGSGCCTRSTVRCGRAPAPDRTP